MGAWVLSQQCKGCTDFRVKAGSSIGKVCSSISRFRETNTFYNLQLRDGTSEDLQTQVESVQAAHMEGQRQLQECQAELTKAHTEHSHVAAQYQQYTTQLASQMEALQKQVRCVSYICFMICIRF